MKRTSPLRTKERSYLTKRGMETWQLVLIILALVMLVLVIVWYAGLNKGIKDLLGQLAGGL